MPYLFVLLFYALFLASAVTLVVTAHPVWAAIVLLIMCLTKVSVNTKGGD